MIFGSAAFVGMWLLRKIRFNQNSLLPALAILLAGAFFVVLVFLIIFWGRLHNMVLGSPAEAGSDNGRVAQWALAIPRVLASPIVGYGPGNSTAIVGWSSPGGEFSLDSYAISLLTEVGIPGFVFFFGMIVTGVVFGAWQYITKPTREAAIAGPLASSLVAFGFYRFYLSQRENHTLFFILIGLITWLMSARTRSAAGHAPAAIPATRNVAARLSAAKSWEAV